MGRIASLTSGVDAGPTPMAREIQGFIRLVSMIAITTGSIIFIVAMVHLKKKNHRTTYRFFFNLSHFVALTGPWIQLD